MAEPERVVEKYDTWQEARDRMSAVRLAGFHAQATDMGDKIHVIIDGGKKQTPLSRLAELDRDAADREYERATRTPHGRGAK